MHHKQIRIVHRNLEDGYDLNFSLMVLEGNLTLKSIENAIDQIQIHRASEITTISLSVDDLKSEDIPELVDKFSLLKKVTSLELLNFGSNRSIGDRSLRENIGYVFKALLSHNSLEKISISGFTLSDIDAEIIASTAHSCTSPKSFVFINSNDFTISGNILKKLHQSFEMNSCSLTFT